MEKIDIGYAELAYRWIDPEERRSDQVILFLHEGLGSIEMWKNYPQQVCDATGMKGLMYDREGYGHSTPLRSKRDSSYLEDYALEELPAFLRSMSLDGDLILYGHSDGGSIALIYAAMYPDQVDAIITEAAHVFVEDITVAGIHPAAKLFETTDLPAKLERYHGEKTRTIFYAWADTWRTEEYRSWNIEQYLSKIKCPVLAIQGVNDQYGTEDQVDAIIGQINGVGQKFMVDDCGHAPWKEKTEQVMDKVVPFLERVDSKG